MILDVLRQPFAIIQTLFQLGVRDIAAHDDGAVQGETGGDRVLRQLGQDLAHWTVQVDAYRLALARFTQRFRDVLAWVVFQFFDPDTVAVDLGLDVAVRRAGDAHAHRTGRAVTRQTDHADVVGEVFAAKLRAEAEVLRFHQQLLLQLDVAERLTMFVTFGRQAIVVLGRRQLDGFQGAFRRGAANHKRDVVRRAGRGAEGAHLLHQVVLQLARREQRFGLLIEIGFVR